MKYLDPDGNYFIVDNDDFGHIKSYVLEKKEKYIRADENDLNVKYYKSDGSGIERSGGSRSWRNNNPGNIRSASNEIGKAGGFSVFSDWATGFNAIISLLKSDNYIDLTIYEAISKYAPSIENDTENYKKLIEKFTGLDGNKKIKELSDSELNSVAQSIQKIEGYFEGETKAFKSEDE